ncbi:hypothetical protein [Nocardia sp. NPDC050412]|uniref:hypothetical protein n=1 Tax=Nocardia sp. NPDC050412 TaxID=3364320 RepID=UPI0037AA8B62
MAAKRTVRVKVARGSQTRWYGPKATFPKGKPHIELGFETGSEKAKVVDVDVAKAIKGIAGKITW